MPLCFLIKCKKEESLNKRESTCQYLFFLKLIGSLVLLIYGMKTVSEALQKLTGGHLRHILGAMTTNRFTGLLTGASYSLPLQQIVSLEEDEYHLVDPNKSFNIENERNNYRNQLKDQNVLDVNNKEYNYQTGDHYMDIISECEKLGDYVVNVVEARTQIKLHNFSTCTFSCIFHLTANLNQIISCLCSRRNFYITIFKGSI